jgi:response regulator RpfG family c-di-GMP phosphodiesterase
VASKSPGNRTLLSIHDDEDTLVLMKVVFLSEIYSVIDKLSGEEGLKYIEENDPVTIVILDFIMREMNGLEFLKRVCRINCVKGLMNYQNR